MKIESVVTTGKAPRLTKMQQVLGKKLKIQDREAGGSVITVGGKRGKVIDYHYDPRPLVETFKGIISNLKGERAIWLTAANLTCLSCYEKISRALKKILNPASLHQSSPEDFIAALEKLQAKLKHSLGTNLSILNDKYGSDYSELYMRENGSLHPKKEFLNMLRVAINSSIKDKHAQVATFQHFSLRVEAVLKHMYFHRNLEDLKVYGIFEEAKKLVTETQSANAGAVFLEANIFKMASTLQKGYRDSLTDRLTNAQNMQGMHTGYSDALRNLPSADRKFYASIPFDSVAIRKTDFAEYFKNLREELKAVEKKCNVTFAKIKHVFLDLKTSAEKSAFLKHITENPYAFIIYQKSGLPVPEISRFIETNKHKKPFFIEAAEIRQAQGQNRNASLVEITALLLQKVSDEFLVGHASPEESLAALIPQIRKNSSYETFIRFINLFAHKTAQLEKCFDELAYAFKTKDQEEVDRILNSVK